MITIKYLGIVRRLFYRDGLSISEIQRRTGLTREQINRPKGTDQKVPYLDPLSVEVRFRLRTALLSTLAVNEHEVVLKTTLVLSASIVKSFKADWVP